MGKFLSQEKLIIIDDSLERVEKVMNILGKKAKNVVEILLFASKSEFDNQVWRSKKDYDKDFLKRIDYLNFNIVMRDLYNDSSNIFLMKMFFKDDTTNISNRINISWAKRHNFERIILHTSDSKMCLDELGITEFVPMSNIMIMDKRSYKEEIKKAKELRVNGLRRDARNVYYTAKKIRRKNKKIGSKINIIKRV